MERKKTTFLNTFLNLSALENALNFKVPACIFFEVAVFLTNRTCTSDRPLKKTRKKKHSYQLTLQKEDVSAGQSKRFGMRYRKSINGDREPLEENLYFCCIISLSLL